MRYDAERDPESAKERPRLDEYSADCDAPVHWVSDAPTSLHGNGAASFERTTRDEHAATCRLCLTLLEGRNEHGAAMCACKRYGPVHVWEPGEWCSPTRVIPPAEETNDE